MGFHSFLWKKLKEADPEIFKLYEQEKKHQNEMLSLNANDNIVSMSILEAASNVFVNVYAEDYKRKKRLKRISLHKKIEKIANQRALNLFKLKKEVWAVNLRPVSGTSANFISFMALSGVKGRILGLQVDYGGHHSFSFLSEQNQKTFTEKIFDIQTYKIFPNGEVNYHEIKDLAIKFKPHIIIAGGYAVSLDFDYEKMSKIAIHTNSILLADIAHPAGLISHHIMNDPFKFCDIVTGVFHKTIGGPRAGFIFCRRKYKQRIFDASTVLCGNSHTHIILQQAISLKQASSKEHRKISKKIVKNARILREELLKYNFNVLSTKCHIILIDLQNQIISFVFEKIADDLKITLNRLSLAIHPNFMHPTGIRLGTTGFTKRGISSKFLPKIAKIFFKIRCLSEWIIHEQKLNDHNFQNINKKYRKLKKFKKIKMQISKIVKKYPIPSLNIT